ncbi:hypothetical protein SAMN05421877_105213 [Sphingobacterium lactis]|uniref:Uncharacterized protein n=1 Tax=Sphingobacterium lactis TaxID=797291 RepID=A0A1H5Y3V3_9SPHI|nr:hypothetical protein SAMN05421877_105213 [Sphingobacterium lactis]
MLSEAVMISFSTIHLLLCLPTSETHFQIAQKQKYPERRTPGILPNQLLT